MDAAEQAIRKKGSNGFSIDEIAGSVGIKKSSLYYHFSSKSELVNEIFENYSKKIFSFLDQTTANEETASGRLLAYIAETRELLNEGDSICLSIALNIDQQSSDTHLISKLDLFHHTNIEWLAATFELGLLDSTIADIGDPVAEANACLALVDGAQLMARTHRNAKYYDDATALLRARVC